MQLVSTLAAVLAQALAGPAAGFGPKPPSPYLPQWGMREPNTSLPHAGLPVLNSTRHSVVFAARSAACDAPRQAACMGTYNHAPIIVGVANLHVLAWHNNEHDEDAPGGRVLYSASTTGGAQWLLPPARVLFANLSARPHAQKRPAAANGTTAPFCALDTNTPAGAYYIKTGGDPANHCGFDGGVHDKCCRRTATSCRWFANYTECGAALAAAADPAARYCLPCAAAPSKIGCPATFLPQRSVARPRGGGGGGGISGTNVYLHGFVRLGQGGGGERMYAVAESYNTVGSICALSSPLAPSARFPARACAPAPSSPS